MQFTTQIPISKSSNPIGYDSGIVSLGSCFAVNISGKFDYFKFRNTVNPYGILFHPQAIEKAIGFALSGKVFAREDLFFHNEQWHCFDIHSELSHPDPDELTRNLNAVTESFKEALLSATHLIVTLGTAWVYRSLHSGKIVANCHKVPQKEFSKELLSVEKVRESLQNILSVIRNANPGCSVIFTVSPVRHTKDGFVENQRSKAHLVAALQEVLDQNPAAYFPSYEIMMDELRDYRFYARDMLHPSGEAIDYIWERFSETFISGESHAVMKEVDAIRKMLLHRPFNPDSDSHRKFRESVQKKISLLLRQNPHLEF